MKKQHRFCEDFKKDLTDEKFNKLTVISPTDKVRRRSKIWVCKCDCGKEKEVSEIDLRNNRVKSCGCAKRKNDLNVNRSIQHQYSKYIYCAKDRNISFDLTLNDFEKLAMENCYYCGLEPHDKRFICNYSKYHNKTDDMISISNGVDRVDSYLGYSLDNCVPCCTTCNIMKSNLSLDKFYERILLIYKNKLNEKKEVNSEAT